jgi:hypothetical protein
MKDLTQLEPSAPGMARIAIWDVLPGTAGVTVEEAVHGVAEPRFGDAAWELIRERSGAVV